MGDAREGGDSSPLQTSPIVIPPGCTSPGERLRLLTQTSLAANPDFNSILEMVSQGLIAFFKVEGILHQFFLVIKVGYPLNHDLLGHHRPRAVPGAYSM